MDYLSRHPQQGRKSEKGEEDKGAEEFIKIVVHDACPKALMLVDVQAATEDDLALTKMKTALRHRQ